MSAAAHPIAEPECKVKGILRFDVIDEHGWEWYVIYKQPNDAKCTASPASLGVRYYDLDGSLKAKVNSRSEGFSWTTDGRRIVEDKKVWVTLSSRSPAEDTTVATSRADSIQSHATTWIVSDIDLYQRASSDITA